MITSSTSASNAARLQLIISHLLMSHNKLCCYRFRWNVLHIITVVFRLVSEEAGTITNNHRLRSADDFQQACVVADVDSSFALLDLNSLTCF